MRHEPHDSRTSRWARAACRCSVGAARGRVGRARVGTLSGVGLGWLLGHAHKREATLEAILAPLPMREPLSSYRRWQQSCLQVAVVDRTGRRGES